MRFGAERGHRDEMTSRPELLMSVLRRTLGSPDGTVFVSDRDGQVIGVIALCLIRHPLSYELSATELVWFVAPEHRGHGLRLLRAAEEWAIRQGATRLSLVAPTTQTERIYGRLGYRAMEPIFIRELPLPSVRFRPMTLDDSALVWAWLWQQPQWNVDDGSPKTLEEFRVGLEQRFAANESARIVLWPDNEPCGVVGFSDMGHGVGMFRGVCFDEAVHGRGIARAAIAQMLSSWFDGGYRKVVAAFFAHNQRIARIFRRLGAVGEGLLVAQVKQQGHPIDMQLVAFFKPESKG